jgi:hypothetical protein
VFLGSGAEGDTVIIKFLMKNLYRFQDSQQSRFVWQEIPKQHQKRESIDSGREIEKLVKIRNIKKDIRILEEKKVMIEESLESLREEYKKVSLIGIATEKIREQKLSLDWADDDTFNADRESNVEVDRDWRPFDMDLISSDELVEIGVETKEAIIILNQHENEIKEYSLNMETYSKMKERVRTMKNPDKILESIKNELEQKEQLLEKSRKQEIGKLNINDVSSQEELEAFQEYNFENDEHMSEYPTIYGERLYETSELISGDCGLKEHYRIYQYFLRNGRQETLKNADKIGTQYHRTELEKDHVLTKLFADAGINIQGEVLEWVEIPKGRSGSIDRDGEKYGGNSETIMLVEGGESYKNDKYVIKPAIEAGYDVNVAQEFSGTIANELSHEIQHKYFYELFSDEAWKNRETASDPFKSFTSEVPGLLFRNNSQAAEFLSDVGDWNNGGYYFRFFNSLDYIYEGAFSRKEGQYWYTYKVQEYAMKEILKEKGYKNPDSIIKNIVKSIDEAGYNDRKEAFAEAKKYFQEEDFEKIAVIYRRIGVQLLKTMKPYFKKNYNE